MRLLVSWIIFWGSDHVVVIVDNSSRRIFLRRALRRLACEGRRSVSSHAPELFADGRTRQAESSADEQELYEQIGRLKMEVEWLKKKSAQLN